MLQLSGKTPTRLLEMPLHMQIMQPDLDEGVQQQRVASVIYDRHKATLGDTLG